MALEIVSEIKDVEAIATARGMHMPRHLDRTYGGGRWQEMKGKATVRLADGTVCQAEIHWFEAHGMGRKDFKVKRVIV